MPSESRISGDQFQALENDALVSALNELGRSINIATTYGSEHPAVEAAVVTAEVALNTLFNQRPTILLGAFHGHLTVDEASVTANGTLLKSLERRLTKLQITGLKLSRGIPRSELTTLVQLLSLREAQQFRAGLAAAGLHYAAAADTVYEAVRDGEKVVSDTDLGEIGSDDVLVLDAADFGADTGLFNADTDGYAKQVLDFLKGEAELAGNSELEKGLSELASDPEKLSRIIIESAAIRKSVSDLNGESLGDIILDSLRRTYEGLHAQPTRQDLEGKSKLRDTLLKLEESILERSHNLSGESDPELDRKIVQTIREMREELGFEAAAIQYMQHRDAIELQKSELQDFIKSRGPEAAENLISYTDFPSAEWRRIVHESGKESNQPHAGLNTLTTVFERLEKMMKSDDSDGTSLKDLLGQANENLDDTLFTTKEKLEVLSQQLKDDVNATIGGHGRNMSQDELLAALSEVAQELMQPLTAITASLEMMLDGFVGEITFDQRDLLDLAANSGEHLKFLMKELIDIVGCPANKGVDSRFHTTSEQVVQLRDAEGQAHLPLSYFQ